MDHNCVGMLLSDVLTWRGYDSLRSNTSNLTPVPCVLTVFSCDCTLKCVYILLAVLGSQVHNILKHAQHLSLLVSGST